MPSAGGGGSESQDGILYCVTSSHGIVRVEIASQRWTPTGVTTPTTAFGYGRDGWWYANGGAGDNDARTLYRLKAELVDDPISGPRPVIEMIGTGARTIEDVAASPDGSTLYGVGEGYLFTIDRKTGVQTDIGPTGFLPVGVAFTDTRELVAADGANLYDLDPATGAATLVGAITPGTTDLAGMPASLGVPASSSPGVIALVLMMIGGVVGWARYRRTT